MEDKLGKNTESDRGFPRVEFKDYYKSTCSIQASSIAIYEQPGTSCIWLGVDNPEPKIMAKHANKHGLKTNQTTGWIDYPIHNDVLISTQMHLDREQVEGLIARLQSWLDSEDGSFE